MNHKAGRNFLKKIKHLEAKTIREKKHNPAGQICEKITHNRVIFTQPD